MSNSGRACAIAAIAFAAASALGCGGEAEPPRVRASEAAASGTLPARFPDDGIRIEQEGDRFTVFVRDAKRFEILQRLAARLQFELEDWSGEDPLLDVYVADATLEVVLARLIEPTPYRLAYENDPASGRNAVRRLELGTPPAANEKTKGGDTPASTDADARTAQPRAYRPATRAETEAALAARAVRQEQRRSEALEASESDDEEARIDAIELGLDAGDPESRDRLHELALRDPSPRVRAAAAEGLSFGRASWELTRALDDSDRRVVIAALEALSWSDDPDVAEAIARKLGDPDPEIATAAEVAFDSVKPRR